MRFSKIGRKILPTAREEFRSIDVMLFIEMKNIILNANHNTYKLWDKSFRQHVITSLLEPLSLSVFK